MDTAGPASRGSEQALVPGELHAIVCRAQALARAAKAGPVLPVLQGKNICVVSSLQEDDSARLFEQAALELGAKVAHVRPSLTATSSDAEVVHTARILGRLYDAVEFEGTPSDLVSRVRREAGVPVWDGIASPQHPTAELVAFLGDELSTQERRRYILQALLLSAMS